MSRVNERNTVVLFGNNDQHMALSDYLKQTGRTFSGGMRELAIKGMQLEKIQQQHLQNIAVSLMNKEDKLW